MKSLRIVLAGLAFCTGWAVATQPSAVPNSSPIYSPTNSTIHSTHHHSKNYGGAVIGILFAILLGLWVISTCVYCTKCLDGLKEKLNNRQASLFLKDMTDVEYAKRLLNIFGEPYSGINDENISGPATCNVMTRDFFFLLCNEQDFFAIFLADKLNPFDAWERASSYFITHSIGFLLYSAVLNAGSSMVIMILNIFIVSPILLIVNKMVYFALALPCCVKHTVNKDGIGLASTAAGRCFSGLFFVVGIACIGGFILASGPEKSNRSFSESKNLIGAWVWNVVAISSFQQLVVYFVPPFINTVDGPLWLRGLARLNKLSCGVFAFGSWHEHRKKVAEILTTQKLPQSEMENEVPQHLIYNQQPSQTQIQQQPGLVYIGQVVPFRYDNLQVVHASYTQPTQVYTA